MEVSILDKLPRIILAITRDPLKVQYLIKTLCFHLKFITIIMLIIRI